MTFEKHQNVYVLKYMNKYYKMVSLVKNIIKQIKTNEKTKGFSWRSYDK